MPIQSVGSAISTGIIQGAELGLQATNQRERSEDRKTLLQQRDQERQDRITQQNEANVDKSLARDRLAKQDERQAAQDARTQAKDELSVLNDEYTQVQNAWKAASADGFDKIDPALRQQLTQQQMDVYARLKEARKKFANPQVAADQTKAKEFMARVQSGQADFDSLNAHDTYKTLTYMLNGPVEDYMRPDPKTPSKKEQAAMDVRAGLDGQNPELLLKGVNVLWSSELAKGVGELRSDGTKIIKKEIDQLVPHPEDPTKFIPVVNVTVERQDGSRGVYKAPITQDRSSDPNDLPRVIDIDEAMEDMGKKETLANIFQGKYANKLAEGAKTAKAEVQPFLDSIMPSAKDSAAAMGVSAPKKKFTRERIDMGDHWEINTLDENSNVVSTEYKQRNERPKSGGDGADKEEDKIARAERTGVITKAEAQDARRRNALGKDADKPSSTSGKQAEAREAIALVDQARGLLKGGATGSYLGRAVDETARFFGASTEGAKKAGGLKALEGALVAKMPKMSGPQSDRDVALYRQQAALIGDDTIPVDTRLAALDVVEEIQKRYAGDETGGAGGKTDTPINKAAAPADRPAPTLPGIKGTSMTPPKEFRAKGRDAAQDFQGALKALEMNPDKADEIRKRLVGAGYPAAAVNAAIK